MEHLTYYVIVYNGKMSFENEVDHLAYGSYEEMINFLDECKNEYGVDYVASVSTIKDGEEIDRYIIKF